MFVLGSVGCGLYSVLCAIITTNRHHCRGEQLICSNCSACPNYNVAIIQVLKNLQTVLEIVFSTASAKCLDVFIDHLKGELRPMESVASDFLKDSIELALRKFFRVIRSVKGSAMGNLSVRTPDLCAEYLSSLFEKIVADLSIPTTMLALDNYFRFKLSRRSLVASIVTPARAERQPPSKPTVQFITSSAEEHKAPKSKSFTGHLGAQLGAVRSDGRKFKCSHP